MKDYWDSYYKEVPLDKIPWQNTQADWFKELVDDGTIKGESALELGCGTGKKAIYLAEHGFDRVVGVDISETAIKYANENLQKSDVQDKVTFHTHDVTDLSFLKDEQFDFSLEWAVLHAISQDLQLRYVQQIVNHTHKGSQLLMRVFSKRGTDNQEYFEVEMNRVNRRVFLFNQKDIEELYGEHFKIIQSNQSSPRMQVDYSFDEYLMERL